MSHHGDGPAPTGSALAVREATAVGTAPGGRGPRGGASGRTRRPRGVRGREGLWGWLFVSPMVIVLGLFLVLPILMALWVSLLHWDGQSNPFSSAADFVGIRNYTDLLSTSGLNHTLFMTAVRNNLYYVLLVVPCQTALALALAVVVNKRWLKGKSLFRTVFFFPSVTSSIAVSTIFLFLFQGSGAVNSLLKWVGVTGPRWFTNANGLTWTVLGRLGLVDQNRPPAALAGHGFLGLSWWDWLSGPSIAMCTIIVLAVWTTSGTFMLMFLAALQDVPAELEEAALLDGAGRWQSFRNVTLPALRPVIFLVLTLGLISTWQVFDAVYVMSQGAPGNTTLTPAFLSYTDGFQNGAYGIAAATAFVLLAVIMLMTMLQRRLLRERDERPGPVRRLLGGAR